MKIKLAYGKTGLEISLPDDVSVTVVEPEYVDGLLDQAGVVQDALRRPIGSPPLKALVKPSDKVGIAFSDITRPTPNHLILPALLSEPTCPTSRSYFSTQLGRTVSTRKPSFAGCSVTRS
ncbi:MAG: lactate racemase domain-containing protein [Anaerolineae bacterium]